MQDNSSFYKSITDQEVYNHVKTMAMIYLNIRKLEKRYNRN